MAKKTQKTISRAEMNRRVGRARLVPNMAHLPSFGLLTPNWDYQDSVLITRAEAILRAQGVAFRKVTEAAMALFWYEDAEGERRLHDWTDTDGG